MQFFNLRLQLQNFMLSYLQKVIEVKLVKTIDKELFKAIVEDSTYGKMILKALIFQILNTPIKKISYINNTDGIIVETSKSYINIMFNSSDYSRTKRMQNFIIFASFYSDMAKMGKKYIQINLNYGNICDLNTDEGIVKYYFQTNDLEKLVSNISIIDVNVDNLRTECLNGYRNKYDYRYIFMFDLEKEDLKNFYPNDKLKNAFEYVLLKNSTKKQNK